jgi:hypothetical protein
MKFFRDDLYPEGRENINVLSLEKVAENNQVLIEKLREISTRDLGKVNESKGGGNFIRATLIFYQKDSEQDTLNELTINHNITDEKTAKYKPYILEREYEAASSFIRGEMPEIDSRLEQLEQAGAVAKLDKQETLKTSIEILKSDFTKANNLLDQQRRRLKKMEEEGGGVEKGEVTTDLNQQGRGKKGRDSSVSEIKEDCVRIYKREKVATEKLSKCYSMEDIMNVVEEDIKEKQDELSQLSVDRDLDSYLYFKKRKDLILKLTKDDTQFKSVIAIQRGHSEDYLLEDFKESCKGYYDKVVGIQQEKGIIFDRFHLVISSTNESCNRCSTVVEEIHRVLENRFKGENKEIKCKVLYFSNRAIGMRNRFYSEMCSEQEPGTKISYEHEQMSPGRFLQPVINVKPSPQPLNEADSPRGIPSVNYLQTENIGETSSALTPMDIGETSSVPVTNNSRPSSSPQVESYNSTARPRSKTI